MHNLKNSSLNRRIIIAVFLGVNLFLSFFLNLSLTLLFQINFLATAHCAFGGKVILALVFFILEIASIWSLFVNKSIYKLICNIVLQIMCFADICYCVHFIIKQIDPMECIIEIIIDLVFICLVLLDIVKSYKEKSNEDILNEILQDKGNDFLC